MSRAAHTRELRSWSLFALALGTIEGGVLGVVMKSTFATVATASGINAAVAIVVGAPHYANLLSVFWASCSGGRDKVRFLVTVQALSMSSLLLVALAPVSASGLVLVVGGAVGARLLWGGVVTVRTIVWRLNYRRRLRARLTGVLLTASSLLMGVAGVVVGSLITRYPAAFRWVYVMAAACGLAGAILYRRTRIRGHRALLAIEREQMRALRPTSVLASILRADHAYRTYMRCVFLSGFGDLMLIAPLIAIMTDHLHVTPFQQVLVTSSIPMLLVPASIGAWARLMDRVRTIRFQMVHSWCFVIALLVFLLAAIGRWPLLLWPAAVLLGICHAGGAIGWNLGHHDFAAPADATSYMSVHATLTGVRGVLAPLVGVGLYELLEACAPGAGAWTFVVPALLCATAALGFAALDRATGADRGHGR